MGLIKSKGSRTRVKGGKRAGTEGTIVKAGRKLTVKTADGEKIKVKRKNAARRVT
jgi:hypothetical protein